ncbi:ChaN family lipoprotein [Aestuariispira insulae]|uniref:Putative iron-regulated protein n=1 Tax=Aestuariispira insulae TaxID=1461337 RepID=A0A3D9HS68_9PROT|nr:ChaN family lipoprotein [Aestuariispira insulae]RED52265.1 putative iron-regulated protein [Aestuariispira insulae]
MTQTSNLVAMAVFAAGIGYSSVGTAETVSGWQSTLGLDHPLTGKIWRVEDQSFVGETALESELRDAVFILLGEIHDNPDHHRLQARLTAAALKDGRKAAVAFEMIDEAQEGHLIQHLQDRPGDAVGLGPAISWQSSGWPDWALYQPIAEAALAQNVRILPASLARPQIKAIYTEGTSSALGDDLYNNLDMARNLPAPVQAAKKEEIIESHCGHLPESMVSPMVEIQTVKDAYMAHVMNLADRDNGGDGAILIAGSGHVRADYGVPEHLRRQAPGRTILTIAMIEIQEGEHSPAAYAGRFKSETAPFDYLWFTPRVAREDMCEKFKSQMKKMGKTDPSQ